MLSDKPFPQLVSFQLRYESLRLKLALSLRKLLTRQGGRYNFSSLRSKDTDSVFGKVVKFEFVRKS